jgi:membrane protein implicated in regulation of membrane protease activity
MSMETFAYVPAWQLFLAIGVVLAVLEIFVPGFVLMPIGVAFAATAPVAAFTASLPLQLAALTIALVSVFLAARRFAPELGKPAVYTGVEGMVGCECEVVETISASQPGYVRLYGDRWQARTYSLEPLPVGARAVIVKLEGNKVLVEPVNPAGVA